MKHITILCDYNYLHYALALVTSIKDNLNNDKIIDFLCLDEKTYYAVSNLNYNINCYKEEILLSNSNVKQLKENNKQYYFWALASLFSNYIMKNTNCESVLYIDSDIYFHLNINILYDEFGNKDVGIFKHRFLYEKHLFNSGTYNVGVVYFKNSEKGKEVLDWWADAVLFKKYPELALCGDQKYLDNFPKMCSDEQIYIDENIGHGAPWNWAEYCLDNIHNYEIEYNLKKQPLVFSHFSNFKYSIVDNKYYHDTTKYMCFTNCNKIYENQNLKKIHDEYFIAIKNADRIINNIKYEQNNDVKIAVGIIVFESDYVLKQCIEQIYPHVTQILIAEGPVKFWYNKGKKTSKDETNNILDNFYDPENKIKITHGVYEEKLEESNAYMKFINDDIDYVWQIDADELYTNEDIIKIKKILIEEKPTSIGVRSCSFFGGFDYHLTGFEFRKDNFLRIFKFIKGTVWADHRPPTMKYPIEIEKKHINSDELYEKWGIQMYHYSYTFPKQVHTKVDYYNTFTNNGSGIIKNYFDEVYLKWICANESEKKEIENKYCGVHEWIPERRGDCYTNKFNGKHPESIVKDYDQLILRFNKEKEKYIVNLWKNSNIPNQQLQLNKLQLNNNYPQHWVNLLKTFDHLNSDIKYNFYDIPCGVGATYKLLLNNNINISYFGFDFSYSMIETAKKEWNYNNFIEKDILSINMMGKNDIMYVDGLLDILPNSSEILQHIISLNSEYIILNRIHISSDNNLTIYDAYGIKTYDYKYKMEQFQNIINSNNYLISYNIDNLFLLKNNKFI